MARTQESTTVISKRDLKTLNEQLGGEWTDSAGHKLSNANQRESWALLLGARTGLIAGGDTPAAWVTRTPVSTEVRIIVQNLTGPSFGLPPTKAMRLVLDAIKDSGQLNNFNNYFPKTGAALAQFAA
jgi:hypothetical protein